MILSDAKVFLEPWMKIVLKKYATFEDYWIDTQLGLNGIFNDIVINRTRNEFINIGNWTQKSSELIYLKYSAREVRFIQDTFIFKDI